MNLLLNSAIMKDKVEAAKSLYGVTDENKDMKDLNKMDGIELNNRETDVKYPAESLTDRGSRLK